MNMATTQQIAQTKSHHQAHQQGTEITVPMQDDMIDPHPIITIKIGTITMIIRTGIGLAGQYPIPTIIVTGITVKATHKGVILGPLTYPHTAAHHTKETQMHTATDETLHTGDPRHTEVSQEITVHPDHVHHTNTPTKHHQKLSYSSTHTAWKNKDRKYKQVTIDVSPSKYYSSDEQASKSDEDLN